MRNMKKALLGLTAAAMLAGSCVAAPSFATEINQDSGSTSSTADFTMNVEENAKWQVNVPTGGALTLKIKDQTLSAPLDVSVVTTDEAFNLNGDELKVSVDKNSIEFTKQGESEKKVTLNLYTDSTYEQSLDNDNPILTATDSNKEDEQDLAMKIYGKVDAQNAEAGATYTSGTLTFTVNVDAPQA